MSPERVHASVLNSINGWYEAWNTFRVESLKAGSRKSKSQLQPWNWREGRGRGSGWIHSVVGTPVSSAAGTERKEYTSFRTPRTFQYPSFFFLSFFFCRRSPMNGEIFAIFFTKGKNKHTCWRGNGRDTGAAFVTLKIYRSPSPVTLKL